MENSPGEASLVAKPGGEKERNGFSRAGLEVSLSGGGRLPGQGGDGSCSLPASIRALRVPPPPAPLGRARAASQGGGHAEHK